MSWARIGSAINGDENSSYLSNKVTVSGDGTVVAVEAYINHNGESSLNIRVFKHDGFSGSQK
tara:strand:+ start:340 stop:525 length:186 start_codon:yes stop_codon:yes gene_type:complete